MIWDYDTACNMRGLWGEVWVTLHMTPPHPRMIHPPPRHQTHALAAPYRRPVIRSRLGGRRTDPPLRHTTHSAH